MSSDPNMTRKQRRAAERAARKSTTSSSASKPSSSGPSMLLISVGAIVIGFIAVAALVLVSGGVGGEETAGVREPDSPAPAQELRDGRTLVLPGATPRVVVESFEDPQCVHCGTFTKRIEPLLIAEHVADGTASYTYNDFVIYSDESMDASVAMRAADVMADKFWDFQHILFFNQAGVEDGSFSRDRLADMAELIGLDRDEFLGLLDDPDLRAAVEAERVRGEELGVSSTPTLFINGEISVGASPWDELDAAVKEAATGA